MSTTFEIDSKLEIYEPREYKSSVQKCFSLIQKQVRDAKGPEACSDFDNEIITTSNGLVSLAEKAFNSHYPLVLSPDAVWLTIAQGLSQHIDQNAEELRNQFVDFDGKETISIYRDGFLKGSNENDWPGAFDEFSEKIGEFIGKKRNLIVGDFSTTGPVEKAASEVALMDAMKNYFDYKCYTCCGISRVTLEGTTADWESIRDKTRVLSEFDLQWWTEHLLPILDQFIDSSKGKVDEDFWRSIYNQNYGSGAHGFSGWVKNFYPYLSTGKETARNAYLGTNNTKIEHDDLPPPISKVPFTWVYYEQEFEMEFVAGIVGLKQDKDKSIKSYIGWAVQDRTQQPALKNNNSS